ncbi:DUF1571 domain-containing protein [Thalassoglobus sp. JC818]|uniref:DUF1571 domain-containing protein n=1 Tax=Thalassoglobus sp. JC818 TaxID=3232136 RepID=UPI0034580C61
MESSHLTIRSTQSLAACNFCKIGVYFLMMIALFITSPVAAQETANQHPLVPALEMAKHSLEKLNKIKDYQSTFVKREFINNQLTTEQTLLKVRHKPFSVYMRFISPAPGREVLYVEGKNQNQLLAHEASGLSSLVGTVSLPVNSPTVMANTRHPITDAGMKRLMELVIEQWELESKYGEIDVKFYPDAKMGDIACEVIEVTHPRPRRQFKFALTRVFFEKNSRLPVRVENYGFPVPPNQKPQLLEEYTYQNLKLNAGFTDADFDRNNPNYSF